MVHQPQVIQVPVGASAATSSSGDVVTLCPLPQQQQQSPAAATTAMMVAGHGAEAASELPQASEYIGILTNFTNQYISENLPRISYGIRKRI